MTGRTESGLIFYFRPECHLCDDMWQQLLEMQQQRAFELTPVDIERDPELRQQYGSLIPVLAAGDQVICHYFLDPMALEQFLDQGHRDLRQ